VTPDSGQFKYYGGTDPTLTYGFAPALITGDSFSGALARDAGTNVGLYNITQGDLALSSNYDLVFTSGVKFEIKKLVVTVTPDSGQFKYYGGTDPTLTYGFAPALITGDSFSGALARDAGSNVGLYNITQGDLALSSNYDLVFTSGVKFEIKKANATVVVAPYNVTYDTFAHTATVTSITGVNGEMGATVGTVTLNTTHTGAGTYSTDFWSFTGTANYNNISATTITDTINRANAAVVVTPYSVQWDGNPHTATYTITGVNGETGATVGAVTLNSTHTAIGTYNTDSWSFTPTANYNTVGGATITDIIGTAYCFNGFLSPIGGSVETSNGGSFLDPVRAFKLGSTVPIKFILNSWNGSTCGAVVTTGIHILQAIYYSSAVDSDSAIDASPTDAATTDNQFRLTNPEWHYNLSTKGAGFKAGTWLLKATLWDGSVHTVWITIKR
jgi:hypothetical protein